ncbi:MAG: (d)CMP kinase [Candidatus Eisenbacteria bacterium]|nr:(d)CMP kinase [Candidatus Eisenbacteria bacterium]
MSKRRRLAIAIDGPSASGKSTTARAVARALGYLYVDTGAMYRALAWKALKEGLLLSDEAGVSRFLGRTSIECCPVEGSFGVVLDGRSLGAELRAPEVGAMASKVAALPEVRRWMVARQQEIARKGAGVVMEGRDIGTVVLPDADLKIYLDASAEERTARRWREERAKGVSTEPARVEREIAERDRRDMTREHSPLEKASGAVVIDTTRLSVEEQVQRVLEEVHRIAEET